MNGEQLHEFDLQLTEYAMSNLRSHATLAKQYMDPAVFAYMMALDGDDEPLPLLLSDQDFDDLADAVEEGPLYDAWLPYEALHRRSINCVAEIRAALTPSYAEEWAQVSKKLKDRLERGSTELADGIAAVHEWARAARRMLRAMGATHFLPRPEGGFPTPACPAPAGPGEPQTTALSHDSKTSNDTLIAAIVQTQALQVEVRDLLLSQRLVKDFYSTTEAAKILGKAEFTVREWCRLGQCRAEKQKTYRGGRKQWMVPHDELTRLQNEGPAMLGTHRRLSAKN